MDEKPREPHIRERFAESERIEKRLTKERERLDKQAIELAELQSKIGHLKGIEEDFKALQDEYSRITRLYESSKTRIRNLKSEVAEAIDHGQKADANAKRLSRELKVAVNKLATLPNGEVVFRSFETVQWVVSQFFDPKERLVPKRILLIGDGPWPIDDFTVLLEGLGFDVWQNGCDANIEVVVVGRDNWSESIVDGQVEDRDGKSLRMYSQELFVLLLAMQADPLEVAQPEALLSFVHGHPVFEYLFSQEFPWPESAYDDSPPTTVGEGFDGEDASSPLYKMGYSVAQNVDLAPSQRHAILEKAYAESDLPWCISDAYMDDWGAANSRKRLRRIAWHLHIMSRRFRRHQEAVARWESDLAWLKRTRYKSIHRFRWPS